MASLSAINDTINKTIIELIDKILWNLSPKSLNNSNKNPAIRGINNGNIGM
jgi:hypothetical protein